MKRYTWKPIPKDIKYQNEQKKTQSFANKWKLHLSDYKQVEKSEV